jgi:hypothetical protein
MSSQQAVHLCHNVTLASSETASLFYQSTCVLWIPFASIASKGELVWSQFEAITDLQNNPKDELRLNLQYMCMQHAYRNVPLQAHQKNYTRYLKKSVAFWLTAKIIFLFNKSDECQALGHDKAEDCDMPKVSCGGGQVSQRPEMSGQQVRDAEDGLHAILSIQRGKLWRFSTCCKRTGRIPQP